MFVFKCNIDILDTYARENDENSFDTKYVCGMARVKEQPKPPIGRENNWEKRRWQSIYVQE